MIYKWSERYDIIYAETEGHAKRIKRRGDRTSRRGGRGCKKCSGITSNFHWSRRNGYRTCSKISCGDRFRQVLQVHAIYAAAGNGGRRPSRRFSAHFHLRFHGKVLAPCAFFPPLLLLAALALISLSPSALSNEYIMLRAANSIRVATISRNQTMNSFREKETTWKTCVHARHDVHIPALCSANLFLSKCSCTTSSD